MARDLVLDVLAVNRRAQALYQRLGLTDVTSCGDRGTKVTMRSAHRWGVSQAAFLPSTQR